MIFKIHSCWAFTATAALEAHNFISSGEGPTYFSEQNLLDCARGHTTAIIPNYDPCKGGVVNEAFDYAFRNGVVKERFYTYQNKSGECRYAEYSPEKIGARISSYIDIPKGDEEALKRVVAQGILKIIILLKNANMKTFLYSWPCSCCARFFKS